MELHDLKPAPGATRTRRRVGRGPGSGAGKTAGKGPQGPEVAQRLLAPVRIEGGQMPLVAGSRTGLHEQLPDRVPGRQPARPGAGVR